MRLKNVEKAVYYNNKSLVLVDSIENSLYLKGAIYFTKSEIEASKGNFKAAYNASVEYEKINELDNDRALQNKLFELQNDFDLLEKNSQIKQLKLQQLKKQTEITLKNNYIIYISLALCIAILSVAFYLSSYKTIRKKNGIIEAEKLLVKKSLIEKETLLKEIHHRVKNNMQLVISLLKIQASDTNLQNIENFIEISENRIRSMALIHEFLYESDNINYINFENYLKRLCASISASFSGLSHIKIETFVEQTNFDIETAIPLGLIINELVLNAYKHAFIGKNQGIIKIKLLQKNKLYQLIIHDDGLGINQAKMTGKSTGLKIVKLLVSQIRGIIEIENNLGTTFTITFTEIKI
ncbi:MAG: sensor histidine kinase [Flavobacterium sp.]|uniref:sensor histidine kinase n=1 Tax=Flavobacterium sp. TaxID=239 RepID=UPI0032635E62